MSSLRRDRNRSPPRPRTNRRDNQPGPLDRHLLGTQAAARQNPQHGNSKQRSRRTRHRGRSGEPGPRPCDAIGGHRDRSRHGGAVDRRGRAAGPRIRRQSTVSVVHRDASGPRPVQAALDQKAYPAQARDLSFLAGALCGLLANASLDLGREDAADDLARAAWTYATIIGHSPLVGWARGTQALAAIWDHRYADAAQYAEEGLSHLPAGIGAARLHAIRARALAGHRDFAQARAALKAADEASATQQADQLHNGMAGEFAFDTAKLRYYQALVLTRAGYPADAETAAAAAVSLYQAAPSRARSYGCEALAHVQLATARLMSGNADAAAEAIAGLLRLDRARRISSLHEHVEACRELLRGPAYRSSRTAQELGQQLAAFSAVSITSALPGGG